MSLKILVTGGAGFIGSNLIKKLFKLNYSIVVLDNFSNGRKEYLKGVECEVIEGDIRYPETCEVAFKGVDKIVHLAAFGSVVDSVNEPKVNFDINVLGTFNVLNLAVKHNISKVIFSSTGGALVGNAEPPVNEKSLPKPISPYGASKLCCEAYCNAFAESYNLKTICLRFANVYGPNSEHKKGVVNQFSKCLARGEPLTIFGDGTSTRDYIHVDDLCRGILAAISHDGLKNDIVHLATGRETSLTELAKIFLSFERQGEGVLQYKAARLGEVDKNFAYYDRAKELFGYEPEILLEEGMRSTFKYLREFY